MDRQLIERLRKQVKRFGLDTGDDHAEVTTDANVVTITSDCGGDVEIDDVEGLVLKLEALPDDAAIEECGGEVGKPSVWDVILEHGY